MAKLKLSISFRKQYEHLYRYLMDQPNRSDYICRLIQSDMIKKPEVDESVIRRVFMEILQSQIPSNPIPTAQMEDQMAKDDIELLNRLF